MHTLMRQEFKRRFPALAEGGFGGLSVGDGWYRVLSGALAFMDQVRRRTGKPVTIHQIKEKFGGLRIYHGSPMTHLEREVFALLTEAVAEQTCDVCGEPGWIAEKVGWLACRCDSHRNMRFDKEDQPRLDEIAKRLLAGPSVEGLLMPQGKTDFAVGEELGRDQDRYRIRRFRVETPKLPDVSEQSLDDLLAPVVDQQVTSEAGKTILKQWDSEGVTASAMPMGLAWWWDDDSGGE